MLAIDVKSLKEFLADKPDDMKLLVYRKDMETEGYMENVSVNVRKMKAVQKDTWDRFDGNEYSYTAYENDKNGEETIVIG